MNFRTLRQQKGMNQYLLDKNRKQMNLAKASKILAGCMMLLLMSCWQDYESFTPYEIVEEFDIQELFEGFKDDARQFYEGNSGNEIFIVTPKKNVIIIPANYLVYQDGSACDCAVDIEIIEASTKGEILLYGEHTVTNTQLLESAGEIYIQAKSKNGDLLRIADGKSFTLRMQNQDGNPLEDRMELFYGSGEGVQFIWSQADGDSTMWNTANGNEWELRDSLQGWGFGYECFPEELTWINIDKFVDIPDEEKTEVCVKLPEGYTNTNTAVFMVFKDLNSVVALSPDPDNEQWCEPYGKVPVGYEVTFVAISQQGEEIYHLGSSMNTIMFDHLEEFSLEEMSIEDIKEFLMNL